MTCRHRNIVNEAFLSLGEWGTFRRCRDCKEVVPLGEANDTPWVSWEIEAARVAYEYEALGMASEVIETIIAGFVRADRGEKEPWCMGDLVVDMYQCGTLARVIVDTGKDEA